jgi:hypothetical protein
MASQEYFKILSRPNAVHSRVHNFLRYFFMNFCARESPGRAPPAASRPASPRLPAVRSASTFVRLYDPSIRQATAGGPLCQNPNSLLQISGTHRFRIAARPLQISAILPPPLDPAAPRPPPPRSPLASAGAPAAEQNEPRVAAFAPGIAGPRIPSPSPSPRSSLYTLGVLRSSMPSS